MPPVKEPLAGLALLVIFGFLIWYNRPIENVRPFDPYFQPQTPRTIGNDAYEAWLWKDPFGFDPAARSGGAAEAWAKVDKGENPGQESEASVGSRKGEGGKSDRKPHGLTCQVALEEMVSGTSGEGRSAQILAPLVKVTPDTVENKEMRTRQRYAVVAGLIESGYQPLEPDLLHFCSIQEGSREYDMRWERYRHEPENKPDIIVAWIDSEVFTAGKKFLDTDESTAGRSLSRRNFALKELLLSQEIKNNKLYIFDVSNNLSKTRLEQLEAEIKGIDNKNIKLIKLTGPKGETGNEDLAKKLAAELTRRNIKDWPEVIAITEQGSENVAALTNNIQKALGKFFAKQECIKRGCTEEQCDKQECGKQKSDNSSGTAKSGEIRNVFYLKGSDGNPKKIGMQDKNENQAADKAESAPVIDLHQPPPLPVGPGQLDYFHRLAEEIRNVHDTVDIDKRDSGAKAVVILGSDFNDKLLIIEALREKMPNMLILTTELDAQMLYPKHWRSTRNLVVASHFDLRLREKTKKDENEPDEQLFWQRSYQDRFPPFRDSHQTNIFYRTLAIAEGKGSSIDESEKTFPRVFEVGRNGFVLLGDAEKNLAKKDNGLDYPNLDRIVSALMLRGHGEKKGSSDYHPSDSTQENTEKRLGLLFWIMVSLIVFHYAIRPKTGMLTMYLAAGTVGIFAITFVFATDGSGEPLSFTDGVSLWPTLFIQGIAILWAIALFFRAMCELDENFCSLSKNYFRDCLNYLPACKNEYGLDNCGPWSKKIRDLLSKWQFNWRPWLGRLCTLNLRLFLAQLLVLIVSAAVYAWNDVSPTELSFGLCFGILVVLAIFYICVFETDDVSIKRWREKDHHNQGKTEQAVDFPSAYRILRLLREYLHLDKTLNKPSYQENYGSRLWLEYHSYGLLGHRVTRVVAIWLFFAIIETLLVYVLPPWPLPCRGSTTCGWASWTGVLSFTIIMLLLFFILDAVRLNFFWIHKLRKHHPLLASEISRQPARNDLLESFEDMVEMVAERTQAVDKLIYYPMLCIMLMLFSKITYFDNQDLPLSKGITFGAAISFLFFSGFMLRHEANQLRLSIRKKVQNMTVNADYAGDRKNDTLTRLDTIDEGAFQPMFEQPVMQALLIILASVGLFAGEYLKLLG